MLLGLTLFVYELSLKLSLMLSVTNAPVVAFIYPILATLSISPRLVPAQILNQEN